jgi:hypothetical protein
MPSHAAVLAALAATPLVLSSCTSTDSCVAAGTRVATPRGWVRSSSCARATPCSRSTSRRACSSPRRSPRVRRSRRECLELTCGDRTLLVTPDHPIFAPARDGFVDAGRVALGQVGEVLLVDLPIAEATPRVAAIGPCRTYAGVHDVYDLSVAGQHRTFIAAGFVVHNKSYQPQTTTGRPPSTGGEPTTTAGTTGATGTGGTTTDTTGGTTGTTADTGSGPFGCGPDLAVRARRGVLRDRLRRHRAEDLLCLQADPRRVRGHPRLHVPRRAARRPGLHRRPGHRRHRHVLLPVTLHELPAS